MLQGVVGGCGQREHAYDNTAAHQAQSNRQNAAAVANQTTEVGFQDDCQSSSAMQHVHR